MKYNMNIKSEKLLNILSKIIFIIYLGLIIWVIMFKCNLHVSLYDAYYYLKQFTLKERFLVFITPFKNYFTGGLEVPKYIFDMDDFLNVILFIPLGLYLSYFIKNHKFIKVLIITICTSAFFEFFQLFSLIGSFTTQDFITNICGGILGYLMFRLMFYKGFTERKLMILNIVSIVAIVVFTPILIYAIINTIKNIDIYIKILNRTW